MYWVQGPSSVCALVDRTDLDELGIRVHEGVAANGYGFRDCCWSVGDPFPDEASDGDVDSHGGVTRYHTMEPVDNGPRVEATWCGSRARHGRHSERFLNPRVLGSNPSGLTTFAAGSIVARTLLPYLSRDARPLDKPPNGSAPDGRVARREPKRR